MTAENREQPRDDERGRKLDAEQLELLRDALWNHDLGRDPNGARLADAVREVLDAIGGRP